MATRVVVLAGADDPGAWAVAAAIAARHGPGAVVGVRPDELAMGARWHHHVSAAGARTTIGLADGSALADHDIAAVLNRVEGLPPLGFLRSGARDREYAGAEIQALYVSWLHGLDGLVVNAVDGHGPIGRWPRLRWLALAAAHGLAVASLRVGSDGAEVAPPAADHEVLVVGDTAIGPAAGRLGAACVATALAAGCSLAAFRFTGVDDPRLVAVDPNPALRDAAAVDAVTDLLAGALEGGSR